MNNALQTQQAFRTIMRAMERPGSMYLLGHAVEETTEGLRSIAEALFDRDVTFCVIGDASVAQLIATVQEVTGSRVTEPALADFIIVTGGSSRRGLLAAKRGTPEYPDRGATILFDVESLAGGTSSDFLARLSGPGIAGEKFIKIRGLDREELIHLGKLNGGYPLGIDSIFIDRNGRIMCIPRSTKIQLG